jgi:hypothetical protein
VPRSGLALRGEYEQDATAFIAEMARQMLLVARSSTDRKTISKSNAKYVLQRMGHEVYGEK